MVSLDGLVQLSGKPLIFLLFPRELVTESTKALFQFSLLHDFYAKRACLFHPLCPALNWGVVGNPIAEFRSSRQRRGTILNAVESIGPSTQQISAEQGKNCDRQ